MTEAKFTDPAARRLGSKIVKRREHLQFTQADLAAASGVTQGHISQIERGQRLPTIPTLNKLRKALGLNDSEFTEWIEAAA